ncbi:MAG: VWA domain-containing protein [Candidatus Muirbacterium halophilum]|nr:VWA domain-containing protein [Candidatus Muirbacterium halophilum]MCK9474866.1 VWA domain-containing protein [Candidatus Muirbacterium halophilum]
MFLSLFYEPINFLLLFLIPLIVIMIVLAYNFRKKFVLKYFTYENFLKNSNFNVKGNFFVRSFLLVFVILLITFTLARPKWGSESININREGIDIIIAVDVSKSMNAEDLKPSRYIRTKESIRNLLSRLTGDRVSLVLFAGDSFIMVPFTTDYYTVSLALDNMDPSDFPIQGTNYANLFNRVRDMADRSQALQKLMIVYSDGEDLEKTPDSFLRLSDYTVYTLGVGTEKGGPVPDFDDKGRRDGVKKYRGNIVISKLEEESLKNIARLNSGKYIKIGYDFAEINTVFNDIQAFDKSVIATEKRERKLEKYRYFLIPAFLFLLFETFFINYWKKRE